MLFSKISTVIFKICPDNTSICSSAKNTLIKFLSETGIKSILQKTENFYMQEQNKYMHIIDDELYFVIDEKNRQVELTDKGMDFLADMGEDRKFYQLPDIGAEIAELEHDASLSANEKAAKKEEIYNIIYNKSKSMNSLVDTLFEYSKYGTSEYKLNLEDTDLAELVREVIAECYCDFEDYGIELDIDVTDSAVNISADKKELKRAISNLIANTYKHNPSGIKVLVKLHQNENVPELIIADSGNEIPKDMNIFDPFVTENKARSIGGGTGLGLAITKRIIDEHQAKICIREDIPQYTKAFVVAFYDA